MTKYCFVQIIAGLLFSLTFMRCGGHPTEPELRSPDELTAEGWVAFEGGDFSLAAAKFDSAIVSDSNFVDAFNGAGWAYGRLALFDTASVRFERAIKLAPNLVEAHAGATLIFHVLNRFTDAIAEAISTLEAEPAFVFSHDSSIDALDVRITLALSYFSIADFVNAAAQMDIIDPANGPHSTVPEELIQEIMRFFQLIR
ncbi:MAG: tetratricopeptide repeat protein [bacterium]